MNEHYLVKVKFHNGIITWENFHSPKHKRKIRDYFKNLFSNEEKICIKGYIKFMEKEHCYREGNDGFGYMIKKDQFHNTIFSWSEINGKSNILLPAYNILNCNLQYNLNESSYSEKKNMCVYRFRILLNIRLQLVELAKQHRDIMDCKYAYSDKYIKMYNEASDKVAMNKAIRKKSAKNYMNKEDMLNYKIQIELYGWESFLWKLKSNCVVLKWKDPEEFTFLDNYFKPGEHYIHVDESNVVDTIKYYLDPKNECEVNKMIENRKTVFEYLNGVGLRNLGIKSIMNNIQCF